MHPTHIGGWCPPTARARCEPSRPAISGAAPQRRGAGSGAAVTPGIEVPQLEAVWPKLMRASLGLVGLLKAQILQLAWLQLQRKEEAFRANYLARAFRGLALGSKLFERPFSCPTAPRSTRQNRCGTQRPKRSNPPFGCRRTSVERGQHGRKASFLAPFEGYPLPPGRIRRSRKLNRPAF